MCERLEHLAKKKARYAQRTEGQRLLIDCVHGVLSNNSRQT